jgi:hypothetical protein
MLVLSGMQWNPRFAAARPQHAAQGATTAVQQPFRAAVDIFCTVTCHAFLRMLFGLQECFTAGYASFNLEPVQYSTTAAAGYPEANKYDPKGVDKYGHETMPAKVSC